MKIMPLTFHFGGSDMQEILPQEQMVEQQEYGCPSSEM
jgi:hypothetical protein